MADISRIGIALVAAMFACVSQASWYWPFGSDDGKPEPPRLSELMEPASQLIDEASDCTVTGTVQNAVAKYREALAMLNRIEAENPERAKLPEFATLRNKRAYVGAAIDSLLLQEVKGNAKSVAVSDTRELEKKFKAERSRKLGDFAIEMAEANAQGKPILSAPSVPSATTPKDARDVATWPAANRRELAMKFIAANDFSSAAQVIDEMLKSRPDSPAALNLKAVMEIRQGKLQQAEQTLERCIAANPGSYYAYFNMCELMLKKGNRVRAKRHYDTGCAYGGPKNPQLEALLK